MLLVAVLVAFIGYGRYRALQTYRQLLRHSGATLTHETDGFTYSQAVQGKTIFTLHAARAVQRDDGNWLLHDAVMTLYGRVAGHADRIYASAVEYDEKNGVARAQGEVNMDLQAPDSLAAGGRAGSPSAVAAAGASALPGEAAARIHVRTSGLVYLRKLGVAATDQPVELRYGGLLCTARGAEFNTGQSTVSLLADVHLTGTVRGQALDVTAAHVEMDRVANVAQIANPALTSGSRSARADHATLMLRPDGSLSVGHAEGHVLLREAAGQATAARLDVALNAQMLPTSASLQGGVVLTGADPLRPLHGTAARVDATFTPQGAPQRVTASGGVHLTQLDRSAAAVRGPAGHATAGLERQLTAATLVATLAAADRRGPHTSSARTPHSALSELTATSSPQQQPELQAQSFAATTGAALRNTRVVADTLHLAFAPASAAEAHSGLRSQPRTLTGLGHTLLQQDDPGVQLRSHADALEVLITTTARPGSAAAKGGLQIASATQSGHVQVYDRSAPTRAGQPPTISTAEGGRAAYEAATDRLTLTQTPSQAVEVRFGSTILQAATIVLDRAQNRTDATGHVRATLLPTSADDSTTAAVARSRAANAAANTADAATHVLAQTAHLDNDTRVAVFRGTDAEPARLWQQASQVQAAVLTLDGQHHTLRARPLAAHAVIHAVFAAPPRAGSAAPAQTARVAAPAMDYDDLARQAIFSGGVVAEGSLGQARADRAEVYLSATNATPKPASTTAQPLQGSLDRILLLGQVRLQQPGRDATGQRLVYTAANRTCMLTGSPGDPPRVEDAQQGTVTGAQLTFATAGSTIVVVGGTSPSHPGHVRTELDLHPRP